MSVSVPLWGGGEGNLSKIIVNLCKEKYFCAFFWQYNNERTFWKIYRTVSFFTHLEWRTKFSTNFKLDEVNVYIMHTSEFYRIVEHIVSVCVVFFLNSVYFFNRAHACYLTLEKFGLLKVVKTVAVF